MAKLRLVFFLLFFPALISTAEARMVCDSVFTLKGVVVDSATNCPVPDAVVAALLPTGSVYATTDSNGIFSIRTKRQPLYVEISIVGYNAKRIRAYKKAKIQNYGFIRLSPRYYVLDEVVVEGFLKYSRHSFRCILPIEYYFLKRVEYRGDTVQFNARAFKLRKYATAGDLLSKLPGVNIDESGRVSFEGEDAARIYVDGKKIFGEDMISLLRFLKAEDVRTLDVYKEAGEADKHLGNGNGKKRPVFNFKTYDRLISVTVGRTFLGYGRDRYRDAEGGRKNRYILGITADHFSEKRNLRINTFGNNIDRGVNVSDGTEFVHPLNPGYNRIGTVSVDGYKDFGNFNFDLGYAYEKRLSETTEETERFYTPVEEYGSRILQDAVSGSRKERGHRFKIGGKWEPARLFLSYKLNTFVGRKEEGWVSRSFIGKNETSVSRIDGNRYTDGDRVSGDYVFELFYKPGSRWNLSMETRLVFDDGNGDNLRSDTSFQNADYTYVRTAESDKISKYDIGIAPGVRYSVSPELDIDLKLIAEKSGDKSRRYAIDKVNGRIDSSRTYFFRDNSEKLIPRLGINFNRKNRQILMGVSAEIAKQNRYDEYYNDRYSPSKFFFSPLFFLNCNMRNIFSNSLGNMTFRYTTSFRLPDAAWRRPVVTGDAPLYLRGGNPELKQTYVHDLYFFISRMKDATMLGIDLRGNYETNPVAYGTLFYDAGREIRNYRNFKVLSGSSLATCINADKAYSASCGINYETALDSIKSIVKLWFGYEYGYASGRMERKLIKSYRHIPACRLGLITDISTNYEFRARYDISYRHVRRNRTASRGLTNRLQIDFTASLWNNILYLQTSYDGQYYRNPDFRTSNFSSHNLNLILNCRIPKHKNAELSFGIFDILDKNKSSIREVTPEYFSNSRLRMAGRYAMVGFTYKFDFKKTCY